MKEEIKQTIEAIDSNPKVSLAITTVFTSNVWLDYGEPIIKGLTSIFGLGVVILIFTKHALDIYKEYKTNKDNENKDI